MWWEKKAGKSSYHAKLSPLLVQKLENHDLKIGKSHIVQAMSYPMVGSAA